MIINRKKAKMVKFLVGALVVEVVYKTTIRAHIRAKLGVEIHA